MLLQVAITNCSPARVPLNTLARFLNDFPQKLEGPAHKDGVTLAGHQLEGISFMIYAVPSLYVGLLSAFGEVSCGITLDESLEGKAEDLARHWKTESDALYEEVMAVEGNVPNERGWLAWFDKL